MPAAAPPPSSDVISGTTGDTDRGDLNAQTGDYMQAVLGTALTAFGYTQPTVLGDILEAAVPHRRRPFDAGTVAGVFLRHETVQKKSERGISIPIATGRFLVCPVFI